MTNRGKTTQRDATKRKDQVIGIGGSVDFDDVIISKGFGTFIMYSKQHFRGDYNKPKLSQEVVLPLRNQTVSE